MSVRHRSCVVSYFGSQGNVLVSDEGIPVICDFGLAIALPGVMTTIRTRTSKDGQGSQRWMAPELINDSDSTFSTATDVWAFGMTVLVCWAF